MRNSMLKRIGALLLTLSLLLSLGSLATAEQAAPALTLEKLQALNGGNLVYTTNDEGYLTFLRGRFSEAPITSQEEAWKALESISGLLGAEETTGFTLNTIVRDDNDYLYYTYMQWQGDTSLTGAIVKLVTDREGNGVAVSSSVLRGAPAETDNLITPEQALAAARKALAEAQPETAYVFYEDSVDKALAQSGDAEGNFHLYFAYAVYTNNPTASVEGADLPYLAHYISATGEYLYCLPVSAIGNSYALQGDDAERTFEGKTAAQYTGEVTDCKGEKRTLTVPVMRDESTGAYYLGDVNRKMVVADCWEYMYNNLNLVIASSADNAGWDDAALIAYDNYIQAYDYYAAVGWISTDGIGTPILLLADYVTPDHQPVNNACYMGNTRGWQTFAVTSQLNHFNEALDVIGHEYTHGVTTANMTTIVYENQYGAINEALSDIMGNLMEMLLGRTDDTTWLVGEQSGEPMRCMTDPNAFGKPAYVGDVYYVPDAEQPGNANDRGGVHLNNSLLAGVAPKLYEGGMTLEEERVLWSSFICLLTPRSTYREACLMLPFAAAVSGLDQHQELIARVLSEIGLDNQNPFGALKDGCALVTMKVAEGVPAGLQRLQFLSETGSFIVTYPGAGADHIALMMEAGKYYASFVIYPEDGSLNVKGYYYTGSGWTTDRDQAMLIEVKAGETVELAEFAAE
ncbi:MAG: M4 family metallopeptidase [Eubacteriales bacterium]|nr:M4 family metallopeptidase [Eubacteriales bacterium]